MLATFDALLAHPVLLLALLAVGAAIGIAIEKLVASIDREKKRAYWRGRNSGRKPGTVATPQRARPESAKDDRTATAADQLRIVMKADFKARALLNKPERRLLGCIDKALAEHSPGWRAMGQVSLGEILYSADRDAFWAINAKRVDLLVIDADFRPLHAIEFQGTGHHGSNDTAARDAVKKEALRRAGIGYVEVVSGDTPTEVRDKIRRLVQRDRPESGAPTAAA